MIAVETDHLPVLLEETIDGLDVRPGGIYVDCTLGLGGHSERIVQLLGPSGTLIAIDRDKDSLEIARQRIQPLHPHCSFHHENFKNLPLILRNLQIQQIDGCLIDLGVSRRQLTIPERGFSFREEGPLDMRMDQSQQTTAELLVNRLPQEELARIFKEYGEEPQHRKVAGAIVAARQKERIRTTAQLADVVAQAKGKSRRKGIHPATQVFQALRIEVNQELEGLDRFLERVIDFLAPDGRLAAISFHSLEDRITKKTFQREAGRCICFRPGAMCTCPRVERVEILTRKPITPSDAELLHNPSARSAKLRIVKRLNPVSTSGRGGA
ncbi:MAG: 16S rRNA (cytosine(1402)-N(4))-methyltransferase RsmH [Acidobacteriota bacterium]|nr:MAG: 16S rRNA (cytosine(1402)-N(4))-methyltransferase RsmH [Acidobacteriota bacterium]